MDGSDSIVSMLYIIKDILALRTYYFITGKSVSKDMEHIKERIADFWDFKEDVRMNEITCNNIQTIISLCKEYFETVIKNNERLCSSETNSYYWLRFDRLKSIISMNPVEHLESWKTRIENKRQFLIDNRQNLFEHGGLHQMIERKGKYIPGKVYNYMKEIFLKIGNLGVCWVLIQVNKFPSLLIMTYQRSIWDVTFVW